MPEFIIFMMGIVIGVIVTSIINAVKLKRVEEKDDDDWLYDADYWKK